MALLRQVQSGGGGEKHKVPRPGDDTLSEDEAMRLAVQRVLSRREERSSRWMALLRNQNVKHELPPNPDTKTGNEVTERKRAERRLAKLEAELRSVERAVAEASTATVRCERQLARELYFEQLLRKQLLPAEEAVAEGAGPQQQEAAKAKLSELLEKAQREAAALAPQIKLGLRQREAEHKAALREQVNGCARRLVDLGRDDVTDVLLAKVDLPTAPPPGAPPPSLKLERTKSRLGLGSDRVGVAAASDSPHSTAQQQAQQQTSPLDDHILRELEQVLEARAKAVPPPGKKRSLKDKLKQVRILEILKSLKVATVDEEGEGGSRTNVPRLD